MGKTPRKLAKQMVMNDKLAPKQTSDIKDMFGSSSASESDIVRELFSSKDIKSRTEVSEREISSVSRLFFLADHIENNALKDMLNTFLTLKVSKKRKSREEFIKGLSSLPKNEMNIPGMK